jgi:hypothetical protein
LSALARRAEDRSPENIARMRAGLTDALHVSGFVLAAVDGVGARLCHPPPAAN